MKAFDFLYQFFNIRPSVPMFMHFFKMKLIGKISWVSLNTVYKRMFNFDSNTFCRFKDCFFKVKASSVVFYGLSLMYKESGEPCLPFYWESDLARFKFWKNT